MKTLSTILVIAAVLLTQDSMPPSFGARWVSMVPAIDLETYRESRRQAAGVLSLCVVRRLPDQLKLNSPELGPSGGGGLSREVK
jgi:hypothetical protein